MHSEQIHTDAVSLAKQAQRINFRIASAVAPIYPREARDLRKYSRRILRRIEDAADCIDTAQGQGLICDSLVWSVEALIVLNLISDLGEQCTLVGAAVESLERLEECLRRIWPRRGA